MDEKMYKAIATLTELTDDVETLLLAHHDAIMRLLAKHYDNAAVAAMMLIGALSASTKKLIQHWDEQTKGRKPPFGEMVALAEEWWAEQLHFEPLSDEDIAELVEEEKKSYAEKMVEEFKNNTN